MLLIEPFDISMVRCSSIVRLILHQAISKNSLHPSGLSWWRCRENKKVISQGRVLDDITKSILADAVCLRLEKWNRILGIICLLISILTSIKLYYQKASDRSDGGQMPVRCSFFNTV